MPWSESVDERMRKIENENTKLLSILEQQRSYDHERNEQFRMLLNAHERILMGDYQQEGLLSWRNKMDSRYKTLIGVSAAIGGAVLELIREKLSAWFLK